MWKGKKSGNCTARGGAWVGFTQTRHLREIMMGWSLYNKSQMKAQKSEP